MLSYQLSVSENILKKDMYYKEHLLLSYTIKYPQFFSDRFTVFVNKLNVYYKADAALYERFHVMKLYQMAVDEYEYAIANNFPVRQYEVFVDYMVTYNKNCTLSLYFDRYEYTGGAHGITKRNSDTWNLRRGKRMELSDFVYPKEKVDTFIKSEILIQIENDMNDMMYFEDYMDLFDENFNIHNFYLSGTGVVVYFQLYEIAPYSSGIPTFTIPFSNNIIVQPSC